MSQATCTFCVKDPLMNYKTSYKSLERKYFEAFNFYFAKPVNEILANVSSSHVILFKDYLYYDDENNEYLKRYYKSEEIRPRVKALTEFYQNSYKQTRPNLCIIEASKIINKRNQKMNKLFLNRNTKDSKKEGNGNNKNAEELKEEENENLLLENILTSNFEKEEENESQLPMCFKYQEEAKENNNEILPFLDQKDEKTKVSYDSSEHDIYNPEFSQNDLIKDLEQLMRPSKTSENKPISLNKIKTRANFKQKEICKNAGKQNYELLLEEIINKQKQNVVENSSNDVFPTTSSFKMNNNILKDFSENRISDISELLNLHEMIRNSQKLASQSSAQKPKDPKKEKLPVPVNKKKENVSSQLTQDSTKRTTGNTTTASQNALKNPEKLKQISHNTLFSQINKFYNKTGNVDQIFELIKKMQRDEEKASFLPLDSKSGKPANRNFSTKSNNNDLMGTGNPGPRFFGSQTDRVPDKTHEQMLLKPKKTVSKLNLNLLDEKFKNDKQQYKQRSPSTSRHSKKIISNNHNQPRKNSTKKPSGNLRGKPNKISFRSLNSNIYSSLRNRSNISSKSHLDTQRSTEMLVFKSQEQLLQKGANTILGGQHKSQLENLEDNESSYGFWTSRSNKVNVEELKRRNKSPELMKKFEMQKNFNLEREDYFNYGFTEKDTSKIKPKTDRFEKDQEINQFLKMAYENPQSLKMKGKKKSENKPGSKRNFKLNLPANVKF